MRIKILHIIKSLGRGGAEMLLPETLKLHDQEEFEFHYIYFLPWKDQMVSALQEAGGRVTCLAASNNIQLMLQMRKVQDYIQEHQIQLIHAHLPWAGFLSRFIFKKTGVPLIYTEHNKQERYHMITFWMNRLTFNWQSLGIAVSEDVAESIYKNISPKVPVQVVLNGVNTVYFKRNRSKSTTLSLSEQSSFSSVPRKQLENEQLNKSQAVQQDNDLLEELRKLKATPNNLVVGTIAVFRFQKRLQEWIQIFAEARKNNANLYGVIVGAGPLEQELLALRKELQLETCLIMPGLQTNTHDWLSLIDIFMMSSVFEGLPIALLEAMSMECAIASTSAGGIKEVIRNEEDGLLTEVEEWPKLVEKLEQLEDDNLRQKLASNARKRVEECFSLRQMVFELETVYKRTAKGR